MYIKTEVRESTIFGRGVFTLEPVTRGRIVCFFPIGTTVIDEERYLQAIAADEHAIVRTGTRYAGRYFTYGQESAPYTFLNHAFEPNLLCHCGVVISRTDIEPEQELTLDYRTLVDDTSLGVYSDAVSGREIRGWSAKQTLLRTARELTEIIESVDGWQG